MAAQVGNTTVQPPAAKKTTRTVRVPQSRMETILARHSTRRRIPAYPGLAVPSNQPEFQKQLRAHLDAAQAVLRKSYDADEAIYRQYVAKGYAEIKVTD